MNWKKISSIGLIETRSIGTTYKVRIYLHRLAIWRQDGERLTWEEVQEVKQFIWGNLVAIEIYPAQEDVVNKRHTRHLWWSREIEDVVSQECRHPEFNETEQNEQ